MSNLFARSRRAISESFAELERAISQLPPRRDPHLDAADRSLTAIGTLLQTDEPDYQAVIALALAGLLALELGR